MVALLIEAISSAIAAVESVPGLQVTHIEPEDLVTMTEIADRAGDGESDDSPHALHHPGARLGGLGRGWT